MPFLKNIQKKSEKTRRKILLAGVIFVAIFLVSFWIWQLKTNVFQAKIEGLPTPEVEIGGIKNIGEIVEELKNISGENLEELKNINKNLEELEEKAPSTKHQAPNPK